MDTFIEPTVKGNFDYWCIIRVHSSAVDLFVCGVFHALVCSTKVMKDQGLIMKVD